MLRSWTHSLSSCLALVACVPQPPDARPEVTQRLDALVQQSAALAQRLAALEEKLGKQGK